MGNLQSLFFGSLAQALVIGDKDPDLVANAESGRQGKRIEAAQPSRLQLDGDVEDRVVEREQRNSLQPATCISRVFGAATSAGPNRLNCQKSAGHVPLPFGQLHQQRATLGLTKQRLYVARAIQIRNPTDYRRSSRISSRISRLAGPAAGALLLPEARGIKTALCMLAPRSATRRAIGETAGPDGTRLANSRPPPGTRKTPAPLPP